MTQAISTAPLASNRLAGDPFAGERTTSDTNGGMSLWGDDGFGFDDLLDIVNPLQHLPGISVIYREITGDQIGALPRLMGGGLFGGPIGIASAAANVALDATTGNDLGGHMLAFFIGGDETDAPGDPAAPTGPVMLAQGGDRGADGAWDRWTPEQNEAAGAALAEAGPSEPAVPAANLAAAADSVTTPAPAPAPAAPAVGLLPTTSLMAADPNTVPTRMLDALDKYEALARERNASQLDQSI